MRFRDQYDWIVLGDHPGALLSAGLVAKLGLSVLVLPFVKSALTKITHSSQVHDPETNLIPAMIEESGKPWLLSTCLTKLGLQPIENDRFDPSYQAFQLGSQDYRLTLFKNKIKLNIEIGRELNWPGMDQFSEVLEKAEMEVGNYWNSLPTRLTLDPHNRKSGEVGSNSQLFTKLSQLPLNDVLKGLAGASGKNFLEGIWFLSTGQERSYDGSSSTLGETLAALAILRSTSTAKGGLSGFRKILLRLAARSGANVPVQAEAKRLFVEDGRLVGVQVAHRGTLVGATACILGCSLDHLPERMSVSGEKWFQKLKKSPTPVGWKFTLALTIRAEAKVAGIQQKFIWKEEGAPALEFEFATLEDYGVVETDRMLFFLRTVLPFTPESLSPEYQRMVSARMFRQACNLLPFLEFHVTRIFPDFRADPDAFRREMAEVYPYKQLSLIPENLRSFTGPGVGSQSGIEGLFQATGESFPELGPLGSFVAALEGTAWIAHRCGISGPLT